MGWRTELQPIWCFVRDMTFASALTLRRGESPTDARFTAATTAPAPRRASPQKCQRRVAGSVGAEPAASTAVSVRSGERAYGGRAWWVRVVGAYGGCAPRDSSRPALHRLS